MKYRALAIIPARGGSKRIPRKNIKPFLGKPIIGYSIGAALSSGCFEEVMVSTDDKEIAGLSKSFGASIPFMRSAECANDHAMIGDVAEEVILEYSKIGKEFEFFCCILPTAPFISSSKIKQGFESLIRYDADSAVPVVRFGYPVQRALKIEDKKLEMIWPENYNKRSQDLMPAYHDAAQFYWLKTRAFLESKKMFCANTVAVEVPESEAQDIDNEEDWKIAEMKYRILMNRGRDA